MDGSFWKGLNDLSSYSPVAGSRPRFGDGTIDGPDGLAPVTKVIFAPSTPEYCEMDRREYFTFTPDLNGLSANATSRFEDLWLMNLKS